MPSLKHRRLRGDMIDTYKIVTGMYGADKETFKTVRKLGTRGCRHKLFKQHAGSFLKQKSFGNINFRDTSSKLRMSICLKPFFMHAGSIEHLIRRFKRYKIMYFIPFCLPVGFQYNRKVHTQLILLLTFSHLMHI